MSDEQTKGQEVKDQPGLKVKKTRHNRRIVVSESPTLVVTEIQQKAYKGEKIGKTVRKDHKYDPKQRLYAGRAL